MHREIFSVNEFLICLTQSAERKTEERRKEKIGRAHVFGPFKSQAKSIEAKLNENELWGPFPHRRLHEVAAAEVERLLRHRTLKYTDFFFRLVCRVYAGRRLGTDERESASSSNEDTHTSDENIFVFHFIAVLFTNRSLISMWQTQYCRLL